MMRHHNGSGRRTAIPADWETHHGAIAVANYLTEATVNLRKPGGTSVWDETLGRTRTAPFTPFASNVPARIEPISAAQVNVVEEQKWVLGYRVIVPRDTAPSPTQLDEGVQIDVVTCSGDPMLAGVSMKVRDVERGDHRLERVLVADLNS